MEKTKYKFPKEDGIQRQEREMRLVWDDGLCQFCFTKTDNVYQFHKEIITWLDSLMLICKGCAGEMEAMDTLWKNGGI